MYLVIYAYLHTIIRPIIFYWSCKDLIEYICFSLENRSLFCNISVQIKTVYCIQQLLFVFFSLVTVIPCLVNKRSSGLFSDGFFLQKSPEDRNCKYDDLYRIVSSRMLYRALHLQCNI